MVGYRTYFLRPALKSLQMLNVGAISSPAHAYLCSGLVHTFVIMAGVTVVATAHTLLESSGKVEVSGEV